MNTNFKIKSSSVPGLKLETPTISYAQFVSLLAKKLPSKTEDMLHAVVGVSGESGELLDAVKKTWIYNKSLDRENVVEEIGDILFYLQHLQNILIITDEEIFEHNVSKLSVRYADGYSDTVAQDRADKQ